MALISPATKRRIERKTGLVLSDAVNVAMLLLTLFSLIIAIVNVAVAVWTYVAAERGGKEQLTALEKQTGTLNTAADLLKEQTNRLSADTPYSSPTTWQDGGIVLFEKATLYTSKIYGRPPAYRFEIKVPDNIRAFDLNYHLIGSNFPGIDGTVFIDQGERLSAQ